MESQKELIVIKYKLKTEFEQKRHDFIMLELQEAGKKGIKIINRGD